MPVGRWLLGLSGVAPLALLGTSCGREAADIGLVLRAPQGVLDSATKVQLSVFDSKAAKCFTTGHVDPSIPKGEGTQKFDLESSGCRGGAKWCKDIELDKDDSSKMFAVVATSAVGTVAEGCTVAKIDQDPLEVSIRVKRYNPPACCNDGELQVGEQCEGAPAAFDCFTGEQVSGACLGIDYTEACDCNCVARENALDRPPGAPSPPPSTRLELAMTFAPGVGLLDKGLRAVFTNTLGTNERSDVELRAMTADLLSINDPQVASLIGPLKIPVSCSPPDNGATLDQKSPSIATVSNTAVLVAYLSNEAQASIFGVYVSHQGESGCQESTPQRADTAGVTATEPDVAAGPGGSALVTWIAGGQARARIWTQGANPPLTPPQDIVIAASATLARVAGSEQGWVVVYSGAGSGDGDGVFLVRVDPTGVPAEPVLVNGVTMGVQDLPDVAVLDDGRAMVVWHSGGDVFFQRYTADGQPSADDQATSLHVVQDGPTTTQTNPTVAASVGFGEFFAAAWEYADLGIIGARYVGGDEGFLFNTVTGQNDDWLASHPLIPGARRQPSIAIGGNGWVAIGWHDETTPGVWVRRFPLPTQ